VRKEYTDYIRCTFNIYIYFSGLTATSIMKLQFEIGQLKYIAFEHPETAQYIIYKLLPRYQDLLNAVKFSSPMPNPDKVQFGVLYGPIDLS